jgi:hypothetical protein
MGYGELPGEDVLTESVATISTLVSDLGQEPEPEPEPEPVLEVREPLDEEEEKPKVPKKVTRVTMKGGGFWQKQERKEAKWNAFARRVQAKERALEAIAKKYLGAQADRIAKRVKQYPTLNMIDKWAVLDKGKEAGLYADAAMPWYVDSYKRAVSAGLAACKGEIFEGEGKSGFWTPEMEEKIRRMMLFSGTKISETSMQDVMDLLEQAEMESWTVEELAKAIQEDLGIKERWRARRIAMTEAAKVENAGELEGYRQNEFVTLKGWLCSFLELSREAHIEADGRYSDDPIPLDDPFSVGGEQMMEPLDDSLGATAGNIINCKCTLFPQTEEI